MNVCTTIYLTLSLDSSLWTRRITPLNVILLARWLIYTLVGMRAKVIALAL
jgi:hypothetical protein